MAKVFNEIKKIRWIKAKDLAMQFIYVMLIFLFSVGISYLFNSGISAIMKVIYAF